MLSDLPKLNQFHVLNPRIVLKKSDQDNSLLWISIPGVYFCMYLTYKEAKKERFNQDWNVPIKHQLIGKDRSKMLGFFFYPYKPHYFQNFRGEQNKFLYFEWIKTTPPPQKTPTKNNKLPPCCHYLISTTFELVGFSNILISLTHNFST